MIMGLPLFLTNECCHFHVRAMMPSMLCKYDKPWNLNTLRLLNDCHVFIGNSIFQKSADIHSNDN